MTISAFSIVKNEAQFIGYGAMSILPYVDEIVYADGNSTDGTLELLTYINDKYAFGRLKILKNMDCSDLKDDYVRLFNDTMKQCTSSYLWYCHPDMVLTNPGRLTQVNHNPGRLTQVNHNPLTDYGYYVNMRSFAGEDLDMEIVKGRTNKWKTIMANKFGLHYWGVYGHSDEDMYFKSITGNSHQVHKDMSKYPYKVGDSGIHMWHFCECKPRKRREEKMKNVFTATGVFVKNGPTLEDSVHMFDTITSHPRVHLQSSKGGMFGDFEFVPRTDPLPEVFAKHKDEFDKVLGKGNA